MSKLRENKLVSMVATGVVASLGVALLSSFGSERSIRSLATLITFSSFIELVSNEPRFSSVILTSSSYNGSSDSYKSVFEINYTK